MMQRRVAYIDAACRSSVDLQYSENQQNYQVINYAGYGMTHPEP